MKILIRECRGISLKLYYFAKYGYNQTGSWPVFSTDAKIWNKTDKNQLSKNQIKNKKKIQKQNQKKRRRKRKKTNIYIYFTININFPFRNFWHFEWLLPQNPSNQISQLSWFFQTLLKTFWKSRNRVLWNYFCLKGISKPTPQKTFIKNIRFWRPRNQPKTWKSELNFFAHALPNSI